MRATFQHGKGVVTPGNLPITSEVPLSLAPSATTEYTLTVTGDGGSTTAKTTVVVVEPPVIAKFEAQSPRITLGESTRLQVTFTGGSGAIDQGIGAVQSDVPVVVTPQATTTYTLTVTNTLGAVQTQRVTVSVVGAPVINTFDASAAEITAGESSTLSFTYSGGLGTLEPGIGVLSGPGSKVVQPATTTTYTLTVVNELGAVASRSLTIKVHGAPAITHFAAVPPLITQGEFATLEFRHQGGTATLNPGVGDVTNRTSAAVSPEDTTTYVLKVVNNLGQEARQEVTVRVVPPPVLEGFVADQSLVASGSPVQLIAQFSQGSGMVNPGGLPISSGVPLIVNPSVTTDYTVTVTNDAGRSVSRMLQVAVLPPNSLAIHVDLPTSGIIPVPDVTVTGPGGFSQKLSKDALLEKLEPGTYRVLAASVAGGLSGFHPWIPEQTIVLKSGETKLVDVVYPASGLTIMLPGGIPMEFALVPAGEYQMGGDYAACGPVHSVRIPKAIYVARTECTQAQWKSLMSGFSAAFPGDQNPVESITWNQIRESGVGFLDRMNAAIPGWNFRLPTEAEWEYACRAGSLEAYSFPASDKLENYGWYGDNAGGTTHPVAKLKPNAWGLFDMHGNVLEMVEDDSHMSYDGAPVDGSAWNDNPRNVMKVSRGGAYKFGAGFAWCFMRPVSHWCEARLPELGFRVVTDVPAKSR